MGDLPDDPFGEGNSHSDDAATAVGIAVLQTLLDGWAYAIVERDGEDGYDVTGVNRADY